MSVVSVTYSNNNIVVISDRAISSDDKVQDLQLPLTNVSPQIPTPVFAFEIKTRIIQQSLCISYVGAVDEIETVDHNLTDYFLYRDVSVEALNVFLKDFPMNEYQNSSFSFLIDDQKALPNKVGSFFFGKWDVHTIPESDEVIIAGSGRSGWMSGFQYHSNLLSSTDLSLPSHLRKMLIVTLEFINSERNTAENLMEGWGGGFDIVYHLNKRFHRLDNIAYAFWRVDLVDPQNIELEAVIHNSYTDENLIIRNFTALTFQSYVIKQIGSKKPIATNPAIPCQSTLVVSCLHIFDNGEFQRSTHLIYTPPSQEIMFCATESNGSFGLNFQNPYMEYLREVMGEYHN